MTFWARIWPETFL